VSGLQRFQALGRRPKADGRERMNDTERAYHDDILLPQLLSGDLISIQFEFVGFRMANRTHYYPDFLTVGKNGELVLHEVKGSYVTEDAWLKFKAFAEISPIPIKFAKLVKKGCWQITDH
jgi:hypothetical protein